MDTLFDISRLVIFVGDSFFCAYILYRLWRLEHSSLVILRIIALCWVMFITIVYPLLDLMWAEGERTKAIIVPEMINKSFNYWELSVGLLTTFVLYIIYMSIKSGTYGYSKSH